MYAAAVGREGIGIALAQLVDGPAPRTVGIVYPTEFTEDLSVIRLYRRWLEAGDSALWMAQSRAFLDAIERGDGRIECIALPHSYMHLSSLIGTS